MTEATLSPEDRAAPVQFGDNRPPVAFWDRVQPEYNSGCWLWTGALAPKNYGRIYDCGKAIAAHRLALEASVGPPPLRGLLACHTCDNPPCVNPAHLWWGTPADNTQDSVSKGRHKNATQAHCARGHELTPDNVYLQQDRGWTTRKCKMCRKIANKAYRDRYGRGGRAAPETLEHHGGAKLDEAAVAQIKARLGGASNAALASEFGVSHHAVSSIRRGLTWRHVAPAERDSAA